MSKTTRPVPSWNGVSAGGTATLNLPIGLTYHGLVYYLQGTTFGLVELAEMRFKINGREIYVMTGGDLDVSNKYEGLSAFDAANDLLSQYFDRPRLKTRQNTELTAIGTGAPFQNNPDVAFFNPTPATTFQMEIDIAATASAPILTTKALQSGASPLGAMVKRRRFNFSPSGAGDYEISDLPRGDAINKSDVTRVRLTRDNFLAFDRTVTENVKFQEDGGIRVPQTNWFVIDPSEFGNGSEAIISAVQDFRLTITTSAAETLTVYVDYLGGLQGQ